MPETGFTPAEKIFSASAAPSIAGAPTGIRLVTFASGQCGATGFSTGLAIFQPGALLPYHTHECSEAVTVVAGAALAEVEGRSYRLHAGDSVHFPRGVPHQVSNPDADRPLVAHTAFGSARPVREMIAGAFAVQDRGSGIQQLGDPETLMRLQDCPVYELAENAFFYDLFARRFGAVGICGGYGRFLPGASLPCHTHEYDESITIVEGTAICLVDGRKYQVSAYDTAYIPRGTPHRFLNNTQAAMAMVWVYAGDEPDRTIVDPTCCSGSQTDIPPTT